MSRFIKSPVDRFIKAKDLIDGNPVFMYPPGYQNIALPTVFRTFNDTVFKRPPTIIWLSGVLFSVYGMVGPTEDITELFNFSDEIDSVTNHFSYTDSLRALDTYFYFKGETQSPYIVGITGASEETAFNVGRAAPMLVPNQGERFVGGRILHIHFSDKTFLFAPPTETLEATYNAYLNLLNKQTNLFVENSDSFYHYKFLYVSLSPESAILSYINELGYTREFSDLAVLAERNFVTLLGQGRNYSFDFKTLPVEYSVTPNPPQDVPIVSITNKWKTITDFAREQYRKFQEQVK